MVKDGIEKVRIDLVSTQAGDWVVVYLDGKKEGYEGHSLPTDEFIRLHEEYPHAIFTTHECSDAAEKEAIYSGTLPETLAEALK
jgi:hypothetical protein